MIRKWISFLLILLTISACSSKKEAEKENDESSHQIESIKKIERPISFEDTEVLGVYEGDLNCESCVTKHLLIQLRPNNLYYLDMIYQDSRDGETEINREIGSWDLDDNNQLELSGTAFGSKSYQFLDRENLVLLDRDGQRLPEEMTANFSKSNKRMTSTPPFSLDGMYIYMADAGFIVDCKSGRRFPVAQREANDKLEKMYSRKQKNSNEEIFVKVKAFIDQQDKLEGEGSEDVLVVQKVMSMDKKSGCPNK